MSPNNVMSVFLRTLKSLVSPSVILCFFAPFFISLFIWISTLVMTWRPLYDFFQSFLMPSANSNLPEMLVRFINYLPNGFFQFIMLILLFLIFCPLIIVTTTILTSIISSTFLIQYLGRKHFPSLEKKGAARFGKSMVHLIGSSILYLVFWFLTLPLNLIPGLGMAMPALLTGWYNRRVGAFDVLTEWADDREFERLLHSQDLRSFVISLVASVGIYIPFAVFFTPVITNIALTFYYLEELRLSRPSSIDVF